MKKLFTIIFWLFIASAKAQLPVAEQMINRVMQLWPDSFSVKPGGKARWNYDQGVILKGVEGAWKLTGKGAYFNYIQHSMDYYVKEDGNIYDYKPDDFNIDHINNGKLLLLLYKVTGKEKYLKAINRLRTQLTKHPRTAEGGFWHKKIYPQQMWLDGLYMGQPFYAEYAATFHDSAAFNDITRQFVMMETHARDAKTGLLYHAWDASKQQQWANPITGRSPHVWARAMGWYGMAMVDVLDHFPLKHAGRDSIIQILKRYATAVVAVQDKTDGLWFDIIDRPQEPKNYKEASASSMFVYSLLKGVRKGYLPASYAIAAKKGYAGILQKFYTNTNGLADFNGTVSVSGLGGNPYRDGSFNYYMNEPVVVNDPKGVGAFIQCCIEMELASIKKITKQKQVLLDQYFNNEFKKDATGKEIRWHYTWNDQSNGGFTFLGNIFESQGAKLASIITAPTAQQLKNTSLYIIVDPDHVKDNPQPNYMNKKDAAAISAWVKAGGVLVLMANDSSNCDLVHFNILSKQFGISFTNKSINMVKGNEFETGIIKSNSNSPIFISNPKMYVKELSVLQLNTNAKVIAKNDSDVVMAFTTYGKGTVFAIGDPWLYNEYVDGRKLPADFENFTAAVELIKWLLSKAK